MTEPFASADPIMVLNALPETAQYPGMTVFLTTDNSLYRSSGSGWIKVGGNAGVRIRVDPNIAFDTGPDAGPEYLDTAELKALDRSIE